MLDFGVEKVVWISTHNRRIFIIDAQQEWQQANFDQDIPLTEDYVLNVAQLLADDRIEF